MRRHAVVLGCAFLGLALFAALAGWFAFGASEPTPTGASLGPIRPYLMGVGFLFLALAGFLAWLASYGGRRR